MIPETFTVRVDCSESIHYEVPGGYRELCMGRKVAMTKHSQSGEGDSLSLLESSGTGNRSEKRREILLDGVATSIFSGGG